VYQLGPKYVGAGVSVRTETCRSLGVSGTEICRSWCFSAERNKLQMVYQ